MNNDQPFLRTGGDPDPAADSAHGLEFTIANGVVTAIESIDGTRTSTLHIPSDATFALGGSTVTETLPGAHDTTVIDYAAETANASLFREASVTHTFDAPTAVGMNGEMSGFSF